VHRVELPGEHGRDAGSPREGIVFEEKCRLRREVRKRVNF